MLSVVRSAVVVLCVLVVGVCVPTAPVARWVHGAVDDTDAYVAAVAPFARDPLVRERLADEVTTRLLETFDPEATVRGAVTTALGPLADLPGASQVVDDAVTAGAAHLRDGVAAGVRYAVGTEAFGTAWDTAQRAAHSGVRWAITSPDIDAAHRPAVGIDADGAVVLDLGTLSDMVVAQLDALRFPVPQALRDLPAAAGVVERLDALRMPVPDALRDLDVQVPVVTSAKLVSARTTLGVIDTWGALAPWVALAAVVVALLVARRRWLVLATCGASALAGTAALLVGAQVAAREVVAQLALPSDGVLALVTDRIVSMLAGGLPSLLADGALLAAAAFLVGVAGLVLTSGRAARGASRSTAAGPDPRLLDA